MLGISLQIIGLWLLPRSPHWNTSTIIDMYYDKNEKLYTSRQQPRDETAGFYFLMAGFSCQTTGHMVFIVVYSAPHFF